MFLYPNLHFLYTFLSAGFFKKLDFTNTILWLNFFLEKHYIDPVTRGPANPLDSAAPTITVSSVNISADTGTSSSDFITNTASQTITGTLSTALATGDILYGSNNNGSSWTDITTKVSSTAISWDGATLSGASNILFKITDAAGNDSTTTGSTAYTLDTTAPTISSIAISSATGIANSYLNAGDIVNITVTTSEAVTVTGTPNLALIIGASTVQASYASGSGSSALIFNYTILANQTDTAGISIAANALSLNSGTINDPAGNATTLTSSAVSSNSSYRVDTTAPTITISSVNISADTGTSSSDFITNTASQTITGTLSTALATGDILYGSINNGTNWTNITNKVSSTAISWNGATLSGASNILFKITDAAGNDSSTTGNTAYTLDTTAPTITISSVNISADTGTSSSDFITNTASQTITGTLSTALATGDILYGSINNGTNWTNITNKVSSTAISWNGATLSGASNILFKITDAAGNDSSTTGNTAYTLDTIAPTATNISGKYYSGSNKIVITGTNYNSLLESNESSSTDIKDRLDWSKISWDIDGNSSFAADDVTFSLSDISSTKVTSDTELSIQLTDAKANSLKATTNYLGAQTDKLDILTGFTRDVSYNSGLLDSLTDGGLIESLAGASSISLGATSTFGANAKLIKPFQVESIWYYYLDANGDGVINHTTQTAEEDRSKVSKVKTVFNKDINGNTGTMDETFRYATINGIKVALPRLGTSNSNILSNDRKPNGTSYSDGGSVSNGSINSTYDDLLAIWDAFNGTSTNENINGIPLPHDYGNINTSWSATPDANMNGNYFLLGYSNGAIGSRGDYPSNWDSSANLILQVFFD